jgi:hypothetical protein
MKKIVTILTSLVLLVSISSCVKEKFDAPPASNNVDPSGLTANTTIANLKTKWVQAQLTKITDDFIISGVVNADDKSGNLYKVISIEDATGGIQIKVDASYLYNDYPIGRKVFVKCKGLYISDYSGLIQLGGYIDVSGTQPALGGIPYAILSSTVVKGMSGIKLTPKDISFGQLKTGAYQSMLVRFPEAQFLPTDTGKVYADVVYKNSMNRTVSDCFGSTAIIRTSGYSAFANQLTASGGGSLTAIASYYSFNAGFDPAGVQLVIRDLNDVQFSGPRCGATTSGGMLGIRQLFASGTTVVPANTKVRGIVISDRTTGNMNTRSLVLQDSTGGLILYFASTHSFNLNDDVEVDISGLSMGNTYGLQVSTVANANATLKGTGSITPKVMTTSEVLGSYPQNESTLIKVVGATLSGGGGNYYFGTASGANITLTDAVGSVALRTLKTATFASAAYPTTAVSVTSIVGAYSGTPQLGIRNTTDVQ